MAETSLVWHMRQIFNNEYGRLEGGDTREVLNIWTYKLSNKFLDVPGNADCELIFDPSRKFLISYVQPDRQSVKSWGWVSQASRYILEHQNELGEASFAMLHSHEGHADTPPSLWVDKLAAASRPDSQSVWAPMCQMQYFVHPVLCLPPSDPNIYLTVERCGGVKGVQFEELVSRSSQVLGHCGCLGEKKPLVLLCLWARTWPGAEALAAATGHELYMRCNDVDGLLWTMRVIGAIKILLEIYPRHLSGALPHKTRIVCHTCAVKLDGVFQSFKISSWAAAQSLGGEGVRLGTLVLERVRVLGDNEASRRTRQHLGTWRQCFSTGWEFQDNMISRISYVRDHLTLLGGALAPCYDEGDKITTVAVLDMMSNVLSLKLWPYPNQFEVDQVASKMLISSSVSHGANLCGQSIELRDKQSVQLFWTDSRDAFDQFCVSPGLGRLKQSAMESWLSRDSSRSIGDILKVLVDTWKRSFAHFRQVGRLIPGVHRCEDLPSCNGVGYVFSTAKPTHWQGISSERKKPSSRSFRSARLVFVLESAQIVSKQRIIAVGIVCDLNKDGWKICGRCGVQHTVAVCGSNITFAEVGALITYEVKLTERRGS